LRYATDRRDNEWALIEPLIPAAKRGGNKRMVNVRGIIDGLLHILSICRFCGFTAREPAPKRPGFVRSRAALHRRDLDRRLF